MTQGIYAIVNTATNGIYVGSSINCERRFREHIGALKRGSHVNRHLANSWGKHGETSFELQILEVVCDPEMLLAREQSWLSFGTYNIAATAGKPPGIGRKYTDAERQKLSEARRGVPRPWLVGKKQSPEQIAKRVEKLRGQKRSQEFCDRLSAMLKGRSSPKMSALLIGNKRGAVPCSEEKRAAISASLRKPAARDRISAVHKGKPKSDEQKAKMAETQRERWKVRHALGLGRSNQK